MRLHRLAVLAIPLLASGAPADEVRVAAASNFSAAMNDLAAAFEQETGHPVRTAFGSSGKFYAQIKNGAPFQVFFSADAAKPLQLEQEGLTAPGTRFTYATGRLALWSARPGFVDPKAAALKQGGFNKLSIANPKLAPYGEAALQVLQNLGIAQDVQAKLVQGENIAQAFQFVQSGNAELGFVALAQIMDSGALKNGSAWIVPANLHAPICQDAVLLKAGADSATAREFLSFVRGARAKAIIASYGYQTDAD